MTAVLGILNKHAIALAADSAVTIGGASGSKIFNRANKLFSLSKFHPVSIMIYNSASLMNTPWEIIIKIYRKNLKDRCFDTIEEYLKDFIKFLQENNYYASTADEEMFLHDFCYKVINEINRTVILENKFDLANIDDQMIQEILLKIEQQVDFQIAFAQEKSDFCQDLVNLDEEEFKEKINSFYDSLIEDIYTRLGYNISQQLSDKIVSFLFLYFKSKEVFTHHTGLVFSGFGDKEIYPQLIPINVSFSLNGKLRYYVDENQCGSISNTNPGAICPFAQTDVINTILMGIDPDFENTYNKNFELSFKKYNEFLIEQIGDSNDELKQQIQALDYDALTRDFFEKNNHARRIKYINPLMNAVNSLSKEDLAEMAESLIYLTYLKRRITFAEESVGGPVDVAIISKGDGFIWIKRKHYFKPELNQQFMNNYFRT